MIVQELLEILANANPNSRVIIQRDAEGNSYSPLAGIDDAIYIPTTTYSGEVYFTNWNADEANMTETEWDEIKLHPRCVVLYPIN